MHRRFTCFPPPHFGSKRLMKLFYPLLVWVQHIIHSSLMKGEIEPHHIWIDFHRSGLAVTDVSYNESSGEPLSEEVPPFPSCLVSTHTLFTTDSVVTLHYTKSSEVSSLLQLFCLEKTHPQILAGMLSSVVFMTVAKLALIIWYHGWHHCIWYKLKNKLTSFGKHGT